MFGTLSDRFGWTFDEIAEMTFPQIQAALGYLGRHPAPWVFMGVPKE